MITLTYKPEVDWSPYHITHLQRCVRRHLEANGIEFRYVWVVEYTKVGKPHYHLLVWMPFSCRVPKPDKAGWWPHGMTNIAWARYAIGYVAKYTSKADLLHKPEAGARMHGNGGLTGDALLEARWWKMPGWVRENHPASEGCKRRKGGGILIPATGEILLTPWRVYFSGSHVYIWRIDDHAPVQ